MNTKICKKCGLEKSTEEFHKSKNRSGRHVYCKTCAIEGAKLSYYRLKQKDGMSDYAKFIKDCLYQITDAIKVKYTCQCCGEKTACCLLFHHCNNGTNKDKNISTIVSQKNIKRLIEEINKCIVVCHNCHQKIHFELLTDNNIPLCKENFEKWKISFNEQKKQYKKRRLRSSKSKDKYKICKCGNKIWKISNMCVACAHLLQRKSERPDLNTLLQQVKELGYCATGRLYGVSDNTIRKWIKCLQNINSG